MTQVFRIMCTAAVFALTFSIQPAAAQHQPEKKTDASELSNKREDVLKKNNKTASPSSANGIRTKSRNSDKQTRVHTIIDLPGYPAYTTTGNPKADEKSYQQAKAAWIKDNPELYKNYLRKEAEKSPRPSVASRRAANPKN
jgi:hypothetical protein